MRGFIFGSLLSLAALPAMASSIETITAGNAITDSSIVSIKCESCVEEHQDAKPEYIVPELTAGTQKLEFVDTDKGRELVRIEAWQGGSPVRRVSMAQVPLIEQEIAYREKMEQNARIATAKKAFDEWADSRIAAIKPQIDMENTTAAVTSEGKTAAADATAIKSEEPEFNPAQLELRLN